MKGGIMFYTYIYHDPERHVPIYVGKGFGDRAFKHLKKNVVNPRFANRLKVLKRKGFEPLIEIIDQSNEEQALSEEVRLIKLFGRKDLKSGPLYNLTDGGEGIRNPSIETRRRMSEGVKASYTDELKRLRSTSQLGIKKSSESKKNMKAAARKRWSSEESLKDRKKLSESGKKRRGVLNGRSKTWSLQAPNGKLHLTSACGDFCKKVGISYHALRNKAVTNDTTPVSRGQSKGWSVLCYTEKL
jgi:hypothetical protein